MLNDKNKHSFCPAHWNDIIYSPPQGYIHGCCKAKPTDISNPEELEQRRRNALNGVKDPGCDYCWKTEEAGEQSLRHYKLSIWDRTLDCEHLTMNVGSLCNFQCTYCNTKYSSKWQTDEKLNGQIIMEYDTEVYYGHTDPVLTVDDYIEFYNNNTPSNSLNVTGGEPFINEIFSEMLDRIDISKIKRVKVSTNLSYPNRKIIDKLLKYSNDTLIIINPSLDTVNNDVQAYLRYGFDPDRFYSNLDYLCKNTNTIIGFNSLVTAQSLFGFDELYKYIYNLKADYERRIKWYFSYCQQPLIHSFKVLKPEEREEPIQKIEQIKDELVEKFDKITIPNSKIDREIVQARSLLSVLNTEEYDENIRRDQQNFFKQFNARKGIETPNELKFLIG